MSDKNTEDKDFNDLLEDFIQSELKDIEDEKEQNRVMFDEPPAKPLPKNSTEEEIVDSLEISEQKLYNAYCDYAETIRQISLDKNLKTPTFHIKADNLYPKYTQKLGNLISLDVLQGWDILFSAYPQEIIKIQPHASDEELLDFAEACTDEILQMAIVSYVEILFEIEGCEIAFEKRFLEFEHKKIEEEIINEHNKRAEIAHQYIAKIEKKKFPINAEKLVNNYFKVAEKDPDGSFEALCTNPAIFAPIEVDKIKPRFFGLIKPSPLTGMIMNSKIGEFLRKLKI